MARTTTKLTVVVTGDIGALEQLSVGASTPLTVAVLDASGNQITSFGAGTQYAVDAALGSTPTGTLTIFKRDDSLAILTPVEGDAIEGRVDQYGAIWVRASTTVITGALPAGNNNIGDVDVASMPTVTVQATNLDIRDLTFAADKVDASGSVLGAGNNNIGDVDVASIAAGDNNIGDVDIASAIPAGTNNIGDVDVLTIPGIVGTIADDATTPGNPVMVGGTAKNFDGTTPGQISAEDDVTRFITDPNRRQYVNTVHPQYWSYHTDVALAISAKSIAADPGDNFGIFITDIVFSCSSTTVGASMALLEGSTRILGPYYLEAVKGRGMAVHFTTPKPVTASTALLLTSPEAVQKSIDITGFVARVN